MIRFGSMSAFVSHLAKIPAEVTVAEHAGLQHAARMLADAAKATLGTYQAEAGPFGAWPSLAPYTQIERTRLGYTPDDPGLRSGAMRDSIMHEAGEAHAVVGSNDPHMVDFEFGTNRQPPRSVLGATAFVHGEAAAHEVGEAVTAAFAGLPIPEKAK